MAQFGALSTCDYFTGPDITPLGTGKEAAERLVNAISVHYAHDEDKRAVLAWLNEYMTSGDFAKRIVDLMNAKTALDCYSQGDCWLNNIMLR